jgi:hypothetical protein
VIGLSVILRVETEMEAMGLSDEPAPKVRYPVPELRVAVERIAVPDSVSCILAPKIIVPATDTGDRLRG